MGSRWTSIAVPLVGLFAVMASLAILAGASVWLFDATGDRLSLPVAPDGSGEVAQVTAPGPGSGSASSPDSGAGAAPESGVAAPAAAELSASVTPLATPTSGSPSRVDRRPDSSGKTPARNGDGSEKDKGKAKGHGKSHGQGNAYGHDKSNAQGQANGHEKSSGAPVAFDPPRGKKLGHVSHSGTGKHSGGRGRSHARSRG